MSRKMIWYWVEVPNHGWVRGLKAFVPLNDPARLKNGYSSCVWLKTMKQAERLWSKLPTGAQCTQFMNVRGKRPRRYVLMEWVKE